jgi:hypothetical protein
MLLQDAFLLKASKNSHAYKLHFLLWLVIVFVLNTMLTAIVCNAASYYVDGTKGNDSNKGTLRSPWKTIHKANTMLKAGDTAIIRAGVYKDAQIAPKNSGRKNVYITYKAHPEDEEHSVVIVSRSNGYKLINNSYIVIDGLYFAYSGAYWGYLQNANHNIISNCKFFQSDSYGGTRIGYSSNYNRWIGNIFEDASKASNCKAWDEEACKDEKYPISNECDCETAPANFISFYSGKGNIVENNIFGNSSHNSIDIETRDYDPWGNSVAENIIIRNNVFQNRYHTGVGVNSKSRVLIEGNVFLSQGEMLADNPSYISRKRTPPIHPAIYIMSDDSIIRYNIIANNQVGFYFGAKKNGAGNNMRFYHNTLYNNNWNVFHSGNDDYDYYGTILINNIFYKAKSREVSNYSDYKGGATTVVYYFNNSWTPNVSTFFFKNTNKFSKTLQQLKQTYPKEWTQDNFEATPGFNDYKNNDFGLSQDSELIDKARHLTLTKNSGTNSKALKVADSKYFYDGWNIPDQKPDFIYIEGSGKAEILSIDYINNRIELKSSFDWEKEKKVFYCVSGKCFNGEAPDVGANEYYDVKAPLNIKIKTSS